MGQSESYADRVRAEVLNFERALEAGGVTHSIPRIFTHWASNYLSPRLTHIFGTAAIPEVFAREILRCSPSASEQPVSILSLGSGDCEFERSVHALLDGHIEAVWSCTDINPKVSEHARACTADTTRYSNFFKFYTIDLNEDFVQGSFDFIIANHSLHHFINLEHIFDCAKRSLKGNGRFIISDMIGRNGHMRWPEALCFVEALWKFLPDKFRYNNHAKCTEGEEFNNYDCTQNGDFEGVRAQDILPLLLKTFHFERFVGFGNIMDIFIDKAYGPNFDPSQEFDLRFIRYLEDVNNALIDDGIIKPTMMIATLSANETECVFDRWSPMFSLRDPSS